MLAAIASATAHVTFAAVITVLVGIAAIPRQIRAGYLIASGLVGEPTAPVIGMAGATNMNS